ncbi:alanine--tRNA ligase [Myxococcota bacterium]|nr:alanine--tRNA ligase [Myxococcota bacterium]MCZ7616993.1 alanine--tRNA ligase [Myxococcota bacterium]
MPLSSREIRASFLRFFEERGHRVVPSAPLVPEGDPTLLFVNAGMVPFKRLFLGDETRDYVRAASSQKCMRVSGKHNDLENVGRTPRHHTFFEMLGNFSFGDYFKRDAIAWAWELITRVWGIPVDKLAVTVFREDDEAAEIWSQAVGVPASRITRLDEADNFWQMGDTGPCGPCSEIYYDWGPQPGCHQTDCDPSCDCGRWLEIWNLVFMQFDRDASGVMTPLPKPSIDTGAGLERVASVLQGVRSNYDTDLFRSILDRAQELAGVRLGSDPEQDVSLRVVADHARSITFLIADGVLPSSEGCGYVLRRILRRAARHGVLLGIERPFLFGVADAVIDEMGDAYPALRERRAYIQDRVRREEERFLETLSKGLSLLEEEVRKAKAARLGMLSGDVVFKLYDTYGFPVDLTEDILLGHQLGFDHAGFETAMQAQRTRARAAWKGSGSEAVGPLYAQLAADFETRFVGYEELSTESRVLALVTRDAGVAQVRAGEAVEVIVEQTPFYAESGGQVGDRGILETATGRIEVEDTRRPIGNLVVHAGKVVRGEVHVDQPVRLVVDSMHRFGAVRHHSGTHLLHGALREVLGPNATQRGSLVTSGRLRFDFSHDAPLTRDQLETIEDLVNGWIGENAPARVETLPYRDAIDAGAIAMFGEKYGDDVRVVSFGSFSKELCGGTHAQASGEIGVLKIVSEGGVAAGVRRIEALTGAEALRRWREQEHTLERTAALLHTPLGGLEARVEKLLEERRVLERELASLRADQRRAASGDLASQAQEIGGVRVLAAKVEGVAGDGLRALVDELRDKLKSAVVLLAAPADGRVTLALGVTPDLKDRLPAGDLIREVAAIVGGKGGGRPDFAQAGGRDPGKIDEAFERLYTSVREKTGVTSR